MKGIVIYKGKYGATQQYAKWLGQDLNLPVVATRDINEDQLKKYDFILLGTSVYIGKLQIKKWLTDNVTFLRNKKIFLFQVAATPVEEKEKRQAYNLSGIPEEILNNFEFYFLPGRMVMQKLSWKDRIMLKMGARLIKDAVAKKKMLTDYNDVKEENIGEIPGKVKNYLQAEMPAVTTQKSVLQF